IRRPRCLPALPYATLFLSAIAGMLAGLGLCMYYMSVTYPFFRDLLGVTAPIASYQWFGINAISAGVFGEEGVGHAHVIHAQPQRSEEHTSELQSRENIVCR